MVRRFVFLIVTVSLASLLLIEAPSGALSRQTARRTTGPVTCSLISVKRFAKFWKAVVDSPDGDFPGMGVPNQFHAPELNIRPARYGACQDQAQQLVVASFVFRSSRAAKKAVRLLNLHEKSGSLSWESSDAELHAVGLVHGATLIVAQTSLVGDQTKDAERLAKAFKSIVPDLRQPPRLAAG